MTVRSKMRQGSRQKPLGVGEEPQHDLDDEDAEDHGYPRR